MSVKTVKVYFRDEIRRAPLARVEGFVGIRELVASLFGPAAAGGKITYKDEDGDNVLICTDEEFQVAIEETTGKTLKLWVTAASKKEAEQRKQQQQKQQPEPEIKGKSASPKSKSSKSEFEIVDADDVDVNAIDDDDDDDVIYPDLSGTQKATNKQLKQLAKENKRRVKLLAKEERRKAKEARKEDKQAQKEERRARKDNDRRWQRSSEENKNCNDGQWRGWREHREQRRQERAKQRSELEEEVNAFLSDEKVIKALQDSLPFVADKLVKHEKLTHILDAVVHSQPVLKEHPLIVRILPIIQGVLGYVPGFVCPILLDIVLDLQPLFKDDHKNNNDNNDNQNSPVPLHRIVKRVLKSIKQSVKRNTPEIHFGVVCDKCPEGSGPIYGNRWKKRGENYDLCDKHYNDLDDEQKNAFHKKEQHHWRPPCAFGIPGFHPGAFFSLFGGGFGGGRHRGNPFFGGGAHPPPHPPPPFAPAPGNPWGPPGAPPHDSTQWRRGPRQPRGDAC